jgi:hypothetical protein
MKTLIQISNSCLYLFLCLILMLSCSSDDPAVEPEPKMVPGNLTAEEVDKISDHMLFVGSTIKEGNSPSAPGGSSLKISIEDTLHLAAGIPVPVKFLHDKLTNIGGAYIQVHSWSASTNAVVYGTYHFDVPELAETNENDTVSIIMVAFDPTDFELPLPIDITITPYDENGQPLDKTEVPVVVDDPITSGECGLVQPGSYWEWEHSYILNLDYVHTWINFGAYPDLPDSTSVYAYYYAPEKLWGGNQMVKGCCNNGNSAYSASCLNTESERVLLFLTYYQQDYESIEFRDNGTFHRVTMENSAKPAPDKTHFCNDIAGVVDITSNNVSHEGNWTITPKVTVSVRNIYEEEDRTVDYLRLQGTSSTGGGWGNPGGAIIRLSCNQLILLQLDQEGGTNDLWKIYKRSTGERWFQFR